MMTAPASSVVLVVSPSVNADARKAYTIRGQLFDGNVDGRRLVKRSTTPFCDAARALLAEGVRCCRGGSSLQNFEEVGTLTPMAALS